jgi:hypothetical protein
MNVKNDMPTMKLKLSLKRETLRPLSDSDLQLLDAVVGGTGCGSSCGATGCVRTLIGPVVE